MTKQEWIANYKKNSNFEGEVWERFRHGFAVLPCECGDDCNGWAFIRMDKLSLQAHLDLHFPKKYDK